VEEKKGAEREERGSGESSVRWGKTRRTSGESTKEDEEKKKRRPSPFFYRKPSKVKGKVLTHQGADVSKERDTLYKKTIYYDNIYEQNRREVGSPAGGTSLRESGKDEKVEGGEV